MNAGTGAVLGLFAGGAVGAVIGGTIGSFSPQAGTDAMPELSDGVGGALIGMVVGAFAGATIAAPGPRRLRR